MENKNKKITIIVGIIVLLITVVGVTYAFFTYNKTSTGTNQLVAGDIYMHYLESPEITITDMMPSSTKPTSYFEFTVRGKNTSSHDIIYDINISHGDDHGTRTERIDDKFLSFTLMEKKPGESEVIKIIMILQVV